MDHITIQPLKMSRHTLTISYWTARALKPPYSDAMTPISYKPDSWQGEDKFGYTTRLGYKRHVNTLMREIHASTDCVVTTYKILHGNDDWVTHIVYYPYRTRGHAMPIMAIIPDCEIRD